MKMFFLVLLMGAIEVVAAENPLKERGITIKPGTEFTVVKTQKLAGASRQQRLIAVVVQGRRRVEIKIIEPFDEAKVKNVIDTEKSGISALFSKTQTPYMGDIAQAIGGCPPAFGPATAAMTFINRPVEVLMGGVTEQLAFGACSAADAAYRGAVFSYYDATSRAMWTWRVFDPWEDKGSKLSSDWLKKIMSIFLG